jgi:hypothetical protein
MGESIEALLAKGFKRAGRKSVEVDGVIRRFLRFVLGDKEELIPEMDSKKS